MSKLLLRASSLLLPVLLLAACGGGGSKSTAKPAETPSSSAISSVLSASSLPALSSSEIYSSSAPSSAVLASSTLSSTSLSSSAPSSAALASSAFSVTSSIAPGSSIASSSLANNIAIEKVSGIIEFKDIDGSEVDAGDVNSVAITISLLNAQDQVVGTKSLLALNSFGEISNTLPFNGEVSGVNPRFIVVHIAREGFTDYARRFEFGPELNLKATLSVVPSEKISASTAVTISGAEVDGFNFSVSEKNDPMDAGVVGGVADLTLSIPKSALPAGTTSIDVKMQAFNPNDVNDAKKFPGAYADSDGNKLLSVAFNYTDITTNTGLSLQKMAASARQSPSLMQKLGWSKTAQEPIIVNRKIPQESCAALRQMGDSSKEFAGFQVPVYTYNSTSGLWDLLGQGTVYSNTGELVVENFKDFDCTSADYILEIKVGNEIFLSNWWNLDYPLVFSQPVKLCADVQLLDQASSPIANNIVFVHDDDEERSFSDESFVTDADGKTHIEIFSLDSTATDTSVELLLDGKNFTSAVKKTITLSQSCVASTAVVIKTTLPAVCKVEGLLKDISGKPLSNAPVYAGASDYISSVFAFGVTGSDGRYSLEVNCEADYNLVDYFSWLSGLSFRNSILDGYEFSVNGSVTAKELSDDGKTSLLQDLVADHSRPFATVFMDEVNASAARLHFIYHGDAYPLTYSFDAIDTATDKVYAHFSGTITKDQLVSTDNGEFFSMPYGSISISHNIIWPPQFLMLKIQGEIKDTTGGKSYVFGNLYDSQYDQED